MKFSVGITHGLPSPLLHDFFQLSARSVENAEGKCGSQVRNTQKESHWKRYASGNHEQTAQEDANDGQ